MALTTGNKALWSDIRNLFDKVNAERARWGYSTSTPTNPGTIQAATVNDLKTRTQAMTATSFLSSVASTSGVASAVVGQPITPGGLNSLSTILDNVKATDGICSPFCASGFNSSAFNITHTPNSSHKSFTFKSVHCSATFNSSHGNNASFTFKSAHCSASFNSSHGNNTSFTFKSAHCSASFNSSHGNNTSFTFKSAHCSASFNSSHGNNTSFTFKSAHCSSFEFNSFSFKSSAFNASFGFDANVATCTFNGTVCTTFYASAFNNVVFSFLFNNNFATFAFAPFSFGFNSGFTFQVSSGSGCLAGFNFDNGFTFGCSFTFFTCTSFYGTHRSFTFNATHGTFNSSFTFATTSCGTFGAFKAFSFATTSCGTFGAFKAFSFATTSCGTFGAFKAFTFATSSCRTFGAFNSSFTLNTAPFNSNFTTNGSFGFCTGTFNSASYKIAGFCSSFNAASFFNTL